MLYCCFSNEKILPLPTYNGIGKKTMKSRMKKLYLFITLLCLASSSKAQMLIKAESDTSVVTEYHNGRLWAYRQIGDYVVGITNYKEKDDYGKYYQIAIFVKNLDDKSVTFNPVEITACLYKESGDSLSLLVYSYEKYMKKVKKAQTWSMALYGFASGLNAGMAGYQTTYTTTYGVGGFPYTQVSTTYNHAAASAANIAANTQMMTLDKMMSDDRYVKSQGYLRITTIHPNEGIVGHMNIKRKKGKIMRVKIPVGGQVFSFDWDVSKNKKKQKK